jgi:Flp pilus assembly protein TadG
MRLYRIRTDRAGGKERGAALVEFALILPVLVSLLLGTVTAGIAYGRKLSMSNAVREGARYGATLTANGSWAAAVQTRTQSMATGDLSTGQICTALWKVGTGASYSSSGCTIANPFVANNDHPGSAGDCVVEVWAARPEQIQALFFSTTVTLKARAGARLEATSC